MHGERMSGMCNEYMYLLLAWSLLKFSLQLGYFFEEVIIIP